MTFQSDPKTIRWQIHLQASPELTYEMLTTNDGRALFWAESAMELDKQVQFVFPNGQIWHGKILEAKEASLFKVDYLGNSTVTIEVAEDGAKGSILTLTAEGIVEKDRAELLAGWVSVLLALKAAADFGVDLRNHDSRYTWEKGFVDN
jgi:uncharacterized protein YndB with AHSA1/START domain